MKRQTSECEQQKLIEIRKIGDEKKELELKFNSFAESNNKQKGDLHLQLAKMKKHLTAQRRDTLLQEEKMNEQVKEIADLTEEGKR